MSISATKTFGQPTTRIEDRALLCGKAHFVADIRLPGMLHAAFVRSPHAHAKVVSVDKNRALALPGVVAVLTCDDLRAVTTNDRLVVALPDRTYMQQRDRCILVSDETVHVGEAIAMVVATDAYIAEDAAGLVEIEFELLKAVSDCRTALEHDAPRVHSDATDNLVAAFTTGYGDVDAAFAGAAHIVKETYWLHRGCGHAMECRGSVASHDPVDDKITLWSSTQTPLVAARILAELLGREEAYVRVVAPDVGGGFGPKLVFYPEEAAVVIAALITGRPVKWVEDRREHFIATTPENVVIDAMTYGNGTAVAEVEVDITTAAVKVTRIVFMNDAGRIINPIIAEGQIVGAIAHGIGNALYEWMAYDDEAQPITTTLADYLLVIASDMPKVEIGHRETSTPLNPLGVKGIGESGVLPIPAAVASAIEDALSPFGIRIRQFPIRPRDLSTMLSAGIRGHGD